MTEQQEEFGIGNETNSKSRVNFKGGFTKGGLRNVTAHEIGKGNKFFVLDFEFVDHEGIRSLLHREFIPTGKASAKKTEKEDYDDKRSRFNSRIKHLYEAFATFPETGLGKGAKDWKDFFTKIAEGFNTGGAEGKPIYKGIMIWIKATYNNKNDLQLPLLPNFVERISTSNEHEPKTLEINKTYDKTTQTDAPSPGAPGTFGGTPPPATGNPDFF